MTRTVHIRLQQLLGLPLVSTGLVLALLVSFLVIRVAFSARFEAADTELSRAVEFAIQNPMVEIDPRLLPAIRAVMPTFESNETFAFLKEGKGRKMGATRQEELDALERVALARLDSHPYRSLALVPARPWMIDFATYSFVHVGWLQVLGAALLLMLSAPLLERTWGRRILAAALVSMAFGGALAFRVARQGGQEPLLGAGVLLAGIIAAILVRFPRADVDVLEGLAPLADMRLRVPSWSLAVLWVVWEGLQYWSTRDALPGHLDAAFGASAHLGGAAIGAMAAFVIARTGLEDRYGVAPPVSKQKRTHPGSSFDFERVTSLRARGEVDRAYELLREEAKRSSRHRDAVVTFFEMAVERGETDQAVPPMLQLVREELRRGAPEVAVSHWRTLAESAPKVCIEAAILLRLIRVIREEDGDEHAMLAVQQLLDQRQEKLSTVQILELARIARDLDPDLAAEAAMRVLRTPDLRREHRHEMEELVKQFEPKDDPLPVVRIKELPANPFFDAQDRSAFGDSGVDLGEITDPAALESMGLLAAEPRALVVTSAAPAGLESAALVVRVAERGELKVPFEHVHGVAVVGVRGMGPRPIVLTDVLITGPPPSGRPLRVLRFRSDQYDPCRLVSGAESALAALRDFASALVGRASAADLAASATPSAAGIPIFGSLEEYESQLLRPAVSQLSG